MIGAAPLTRNKNQYGGGYNYNSTEILGFPQIHCWMLSGLTVMPVTGDVDPTGGEVVWKSTFLHLGEIVQPGYHRLYLDKYKVWVEQTATDRVSFYRFTYTEANVADLLLNLGGYVGTSTMVNTHVSKKGNNSLRTPRNEGMSYYDAPSSGVKANYQVQPGDQLQMKVAISYVSTENAWVNMEQDCNHWNFDQVRGASQQEWNEWLGKIDVKGGSHNQKIKFYTDLWHSLLGRHKLDDFNGEYPDYTDGTRKGSATQISASTSANWPKTNRETSSTTCTTRMLSG